jgi:hypothetical protein
MGPALTTVEQAQLKFDDPGERARIKQWHAEGVSFLEMLERLGIAVDGTLRAAIAGLSDAEVAIIRKVMVEEIDRAGAGGESKMPVDCDLNREPVPASVNVTEIRKGGRSEAKVVAG